VLSCQPLNRATRPVVDKLWNGARHDTDGLDTPRRGVEPVAHFKSEPANSRTSISRPQHQFASHAAVQPELEFIEEARRAASADRPTPTGRRDDEPTSITAQSGTGC
jgi:hypothetical protein